MIAKPISAEPCAVESDYARALRRQKRLAREHTLSAPSLLYVLLALTGWLATTWLIVAGLFVALFLAAGNGTLAGFFEQIELLARHYLAAEPVRQAAFGQQLVVAGSTVFVVTAFFRRRAVTDIFLGGTDGATITN